MSTSMSLQGGSSGDEIRPAAGGPLSSNPVNSPPNSPGLRKPSQGELQSLLQTSRARSNVLFVYSSRSNVRFDEGNAGDGRKESNTWPYETEALLRGRRRRRCDFAVDVLVVATSLPFFALAGVIFGFCGKIVDAHQRYVLEQFTWAAATLFPLCFSVIVGRALVTLTIWRLDEGAPNGHLERLMGSQTVATAILTQFRQREINPLSILLVFLWLLSPLGSQSALRILSTAQSDNTSSTNVSYVNTRQSSFAGTTAFLGGWFSGFASLFGASLVAPESVKNGEMDLWGNVKTPYMSSLLSLGANPDGWRLIPQNFTPTYSSLFGVPISSLRPDNTTFSIESTYIDLVCGNLTSMQTRSTEHSHDFVDPALISPNGPFLSALNITPTTKWAMGFIGPDATPLLNQSCSDQPCLDCLLPNTSTATIPPSKLLYQDFSGLQNVTSIYCTPSQVNVESRIVCTQPSDLPTVSRSCSVTAQRVSQLPYMSRILTSFNFRDVWMGITQLIPNSTINSSLNGVDLIQNYIFDPFSNSFIQSAQSLALSTSSNLTERESRFLGLDMQDFGDRLGQILNAFLQGSIANSTVYLTGTPLPSSGVNSSSSPILITRGTTTDVSEIYTYSIPFLTTYLFCTTAMFLAALCTAYVTRKYRVPRYRAFTESLAKERYVNLQNGSARSGRM